MFTYSPALILRPSLDEHADDRIDELVVGERYGGKVGGDDRAERLDQSGRRIDVDRLEPMTHVGEDAARRIERVYRLGVDRAERALRRAWRAVGLSAGAEAASRSGRCERRRAVGIAVDVPGHDVEHQRGVAHRARDRSVREEPAPDLAGDGRERHPAARGLEPDHAAARGGDAHRAAAVASLGERTEPGRDLSPRPAARAAGRVLEVPGLSRRRAEAAFGRRPAAVLRGRRLTEQDATRAAEPRDDLGVGGRDEIA